MSEAEPGSLAALRAQGEELLDPQIAERHDGIAKLMGDEPLAQFAS